MELKERRGKKVVIELDYEEFIHLHCLALAAQRIYQDKAENVELNSDERDHANMCVRTAELIRAMVTSDFISDTISSI